MIGVLTSKMVKNSQDFLLAGRKLPMILAGSALFATWFGSETVLGASSEFAQHGIIGIIEDPFGASLCLFLIGVFFARKFYRMDILTFGDFYRNRFGRRVEILSSIFMVPSYFGWVAAQLVALGIILNTITGLSMFWGILLGGGVVLIYTYIGGMWAISVTDFLQTILIVVGLLMVAFHVSEDVGGIDTVIAKTPEGFFNPLPKPDFHHILEYIAAWITIGLGSIPQQDVFQRVMAAKSERVSVRSSYFGAVMYLTVAFIPLYIGLCATQLYPDLVKETQNSQTMLPMVVLRHEGIFVQIMFFGALLSAIMSTTSGAILAPASILAENLIKPLVNKYMDDKTELRLNRLSVIFVAIVSGIMANMKSDIYELVGTSSALSLVSLFVPMMAGLYSKKSNEWGAAGSMILGMISWIVAESLESSTPSILIGLAGSILGLWIGNWWGRKLHPIHHK
jgi:SSS family transporter